MGESNAPGGLGKGTGESACGIVPSGQSWPGQPGVPSWTAWRWWEKELTKISPGARWVQGPPPCLGLGAGTPATLRLSSPFSLDPALRGGWTQKNPNTFLTFPTCKISRSPGGMSRSLLDLPWDRQSGCSPTWGDPGAPQTPAVCSALCACARRGRGLSGWEAPRDDKRRPPPSFTPTRGGHKPASINAAPGSPPHLNFPPSSSRRAQDPLSISRSITPVRSPPPPHLPAFSALPSLGGRHPTLRDEHIFTLSVFSFPNGVAGARCPATSRF